MSGQSLDNPYAAPQVDLQRADLPQAFDAHLSLPREEVSINQVGAWFVVFFLNLPLPGFLGLMLCRGIGILGLFTAVVGMLLLTTLLLYQSGRFAKCWIAGGLCVAVSQFLPFLHFILGIFATSQFDATRGEFTFVPALICTLIVGTGLLAVSLLLAGIFYLLFIPWDER